jgi:hypothetical protein
MPFALLLGLAAVAGATLLTYLYDRDATLWPRLCAGVCLGFALLGLVGFALASLLGMNASALALAGLVCAAPLLLLLRADVRARAARDVREGGRALRSALSMSREGGALALAFYAAAVLLFWFVFAHAMYETSAGLFTGVDTNLGDMPFHAAVVTGFAHGENFPPQHPEFAGARLTYPFVVDFVTAMFVRAGATLEGAMFWQSFLMILSLTGLLHRWALRLMRGRRAALLVPALVLLSGGFGWWAFVGEAASGARGVFELLGNLEHDYTRAYYNYQWGNAVTALFVTQRSMLLGLSLALVVWTLWWDTGAKAEGGRRKAEGGSDEESLPPEAEVKSRGVGGRKKVKGKGKAARGDVTRVDVKHGHVARGRAARGTSGRGASARESSTDDESVADKTFAFCLKPFAFRQMLAAGVVAGLLPLVHAHSFVVMMSMGACLALLQGACILSSGGEGGGVGDDARRTTLVRVWDAWRPWVVFAAAASVLAVPQMLWATRGSSVDASRFFGWEFGWAHGEENVVWFWIKNTAVFIPLLVAALAWRGREPVVSARLLFFYMPFALCFVVPNVYKLSPWVWDNIKVLFYWWVASAPLVALLLARLWRRGAWAWRVVVVALVLAQTAAGGLDVWRAAVGTERLEIDRDGLALAELIKSKTSPRALILHAPIYNDPVYLTGRRTFLGYPGHVWSHGLNYERREAELKRIYAGAPDASSLVVDNGIEYVVVGPAERAEMKRYGVALNESYFKRFEKVGEAGEYSLYKTRP